MDRRLAVRSRPTFLSADTSRAKQHTGPEAQEQRHAKHKKIPSPTREELKREASETAAFIPTTPEEELEQSSGPEEVNLQSLYRTLEAFGEEAPESRAKRDVCEGWARKA